jgi:nicotinate-nucleotide adenylyltransferase
VRLGIFGGTFDPPHIGHLILAMECRWQLELDQVLWVLTPNPPHKQGQTITPLEARLQMLQACLQDEPGFALSRVDIDRPPPLYAVDTVRLVKAQYPGSEVAYLIGEDSLYDLPDWHTPQDFVAACDILGVMRRPHAQSGRQRPRSLDELEEHIPGLLARLRFVAAPLLEISSTAIRQRVAAGEPYRYYVPAEVHRLIEALHLYQAE